MKNTLGSSRPEGIHSRGTLDDDGEDTTIDISNSEYNPDGMTAAGCVVLLALIVGIVAAMWWIAAGGLNL